MIPCIDIVLLTKYLNKQTFDFNTPRGYYKSMETSNSTKATRRLKIIEGQIRGLQKMIENKAYCIDIITQVSAVKEALSGVEDLLLENHLKSHVMEQFKDGQEDLATAEILKVYKLKQRK